MFDMKKFLALLAAIALALLGITKPDIFSPELAEFLSRPVTAKLSLLIDKLGLTRAWLIAAGVTAGLLSLLVAGLTTWIFPSN